MDTRALPRPCVLAALALAFLMMAGTAGAQTPIPPVPLDPYTQPKFVNPLPNPLDNVLVPDTTTYPGFNYYQVGMRQVRQYLGIVDPATGTPLSTTVWGYNGFYPGPTFEAYRGKPVKVFYTNNLVNKLGQPLPHLLPVDTTVHCGLDVYGQNSYCRPMVRTVPHLHGGHVPDHSDGHPEAWFSAGFGQIGWRWSRTLYDYPNDQHAATLWYHDHAMGATRLNVYAGLAGFYLLRDGTESQLQKEGLLPMYPYEIPMVIQDRSFYNTGALAYPNEPWLDPDTGKPLSLDPITGAVVPSIVPEFFGDHILVNGKTWPVLEVEPRQYRIRILNGSDARFYNLSWGNRLLGASDYILRPPQIWQIGTDGGFLPQPVPISSLLLAPGERADLIVDFSPWYLAGKTFYLSNNANTPYPDGDPPDPRTTGVIMAIKVTKTLSNIPDTKLPEKLEDINDLVPTPGLPAREVLLAEGTDPIGRIQPLLGTSALGPLMWDDPITETPRVGTTEVWSVINTTVDAHPVHLHLVEFQILDRTPFDTASYVPGKPETLVLTGPPVPPDPNETGWKDTVRANPGEVTRVIAKFDLTGFYVWHCHILEHEDHEMMRPLRVVP